MIKVRLSLSYNILHVKKININPLGRDIRCMRGRGASYKEKFSKNVFENKIS
jgi:hypothetical protein